MEDKIFLQLLGVVEHREQKSGSQTTDLGQFVDITRHEISCLHKIISRTRTTALVLQSDDMEFNYILSWKVM